MRCVFDLVTRPANPLALPDDAEQLKAVIARMAEEHASQMVERDSRIAQLEQENRLLRRELFAPKSERRPSGSFSGAPGQMPLLFPELIEAAERVADEKHVEGSIELRSTGKRQVPKRRKQFPPHLPVLRTTYEIPESDRQCTCGAKMEEIGEEISKELERVEVAIVHEIARAKYACKVCACGIKTAPGPDRVIDKGILGVGFLAHLLVERFAQHMPYNRLESKYASEGLDLSRKVMCDAAGRCGEILAPIADQIRKDALASGVVQTDDTPVTIQKGSNNHSRQGHVWVYRGLGGEVFFDMTESRGRDGPRAVLEDYTGFLQADAYVVYDAFYRDGRVLEVGCWAHARRYFIKAEIGEPALAKEAVERIGELYAIERKAKESGLSREALRDLRRAESFPRLERLRDWLTITRTQVLDKGLMAKAIDYALSNWAALTRYCHDGRLAIDNNAAERALRSVAVGRKNWIFFGNVRGGETAAVMYSLVATCKEHGVNPREYLRDVLLRIGQVSDVRELTPYGWKARWQQVVADHRASVLERLSLGSQG